MDDPIFPQEEGDPAFTQEQIEYIQKEFMTKLRHMLMDLGNLRSWLKLVGDIERTEMANKTLSHLEGLEFSLTNWWTS